MVLNGIRDNERYVQLRYIATYKFSWEHLLQFMNCVVDNFETVDPDSGYYVVAGGPLVKVGLIGNPLHFSPDFAEEKGGLSLCGYSSIFKIPMRFEGYNQLNIIDVFIPRSTDVAKQVLENNHSLDVFLDSLEIHAHMGYAKKNVIEKMIKSLNNDADAKKMLKQQCYDVGIMEDPHVEIKCPACNKTFQFDESKIPFGQNYEVPCECGMLMKRKRVYSVAFVDKTNDEMIMDVIEVSNMLRKKQSIYQHKDANETNYKKLLKAMQEVDEKVEETLSHTGITKFRNEGHVVNEKQQEVIGEITTDDFNKHGKIASRFDFGFEKNGKPIQKERVKIFKVEDFFDCNKLPEMLKKYDMDKDNLGFGKCSYPFIMMFNNERRIAWFIYDIGKPQSKASVFVKTLYIMDSNGHIRTQEISFPFVFDWTVDSHNAITIDDYCKLLHEQWNTKAEDNIELLKQIENNAFVTAVYSQFTTFQKQSMTKEEFKKKIQEHNLETIYTYGAFTEAGYRTFNESESWPDDDKSYGVYHDDEKKKWVAYINEHEWSEHRTYEECKNVIAYSQTADNIEDAYDELFKLIIKYKIG